MVVRRRLFGCESSVSDDSGDVIDFLYMTPANSIDSHSLNSSIVETATALVLFTSERGAPLDNKRR